MSRLVSPLLALALLLVLVVPASADHSWRNFHWGRMTRSFTLELGNNTTTAEWSAVLGIAAADWSKSRVLDSVVADGQTTDAQACRPTLGRVEVCNGKYGENQHWIGIARVWIYADGHIAQGTVQNNDSYLSNPRYTRYSTLAYKQFVMCQEIGHTFGLDHQDENFSNENLGTCMDYTRDPDGSIQHQLSNEHPNRHDYEQLETIYAHLDSVTTVGVSGTALGGSFTPHDSQRGITRFETVFPDGTRLVTWVVWAE